MLRCRTAAVGVGLADTLVRAGGLTRLVHRAFLLVGAAGHASFWGSEPALALGKMSASERDDRRQRRQTAQESQHLAKDA